MRDLEKPIVLTGSMIPMSEPGTDAKRNLEDAFRFTEALLANKQSGVALAFAGRLIHGPRAKKMSGKRIEAFKSVYYDELEVSDGKRHPCLKPHSLTGRHFAVTAQDAKGYLFQRNHPGEALPRLQGGLLRQDS